MKKFYTTFILLNTIFFTSDAQKPVASFSADYDTVCWGSLVNFTDLSSNSPTSWQWIFPGAYIETSTDRNQFNYYEASGNYDVTLIVSNSSGTDTLVKHNYINVSPEIPIPSLYSSDYHFFPDTIFCVPDPAYIYYKWFEAKDTSVIELSEGVMNTFWIATHYGDYILEVVDSNCCSISVGIDIHMPLVTKEIKERKKVTLRQPCEFNLSTHLYMPPNNIYITPNPVSSKLVIHSAFHGCSIISIVNLLGQQVSYASSPVEESAGYFIDVSTLRAGIYFVKMETEKGALIKKFIKE
jgi:PKD repeat protein